MAASVESSVPKGLAFQRLFIYKQIFVYVWKSRMVRPKTQSDASVLETALAIMHKRGPEALTFASLAEATGLSGATLVQRFGNKQQLKQRTLLFAWDRLEEQTERLATSVPKTPDGAIQLLVGLTAQYGGIESYSEGLLMLREDLRDPALRARGAAWKASLCEVLDRCLRQTAGPGAGLLAATHWQGALLWWAFDPRRKIEDYVEESLRRFVARLAASPGRDLAPG
jgi:AcrR family transcriptional regulator